jgi:hypothetical protein
MPFPFSSAFLAKRGEGGIFVIWVPGYKRFWIFWLRTIGRRPCLSFQTGRQSASLDLQGPAWLKEQGRNLFEYAAEKNEGDFKRELGI